jgi:hypothetical protein
MRFLMGFLLVTSLAAATPVRAQLEIGTEASATKDGFVLPREGPIRIVVFRPNVYVGEQTTAGINQPNADWTEQARSQLNTALEMALARRSGEMKIMPELFGEDGQMLADYRALFTTIAGTAMVHKLFPGNRLPTKEGTFDWTMGPGAAQLGKLGGGDYGLFFHTYDSYGSSGRKAVQAIGLLMGMGVQSGVHIGYAGLIDFKTGDLVWLNVDVAMGGDVREADGAHRRIEQLLEDFPAREGAQPARTSAQK